MLRRAARRVTWGGVAKSKALSKGPTLSLKTKEIPRVGSGEGNQDPQGTRCALGTVTEHLRMLMRALGVRPAGEGVDLAVASGCS